MLKEGRKMRRVSIVIAICFIFAVALTVTGQQPAVDIDATMKAVQPVWGGLPAKVMANDAAGVAADAARLEGLFRDAQRFFEAEKMAQPAAWSKDAAAAAGAAAAAAKAGKVDSTTKNGININCKQCHDVYRVKGDAGFVLKRQ
jgi:cytochrome c556